MSNDAREGDALDRMDGAQVFEMLTQRGWTFEQLYRVPGNPQSGVAGWRAINIVYAGAGVLTSTETDIRAACKDFARQMVRFVAGVNRATRERSN